MRVCFEVFKVGVASSRFLYNGGSTEATFPNSYEVLIFVPELRTKGE